MAKIKEIELRNIEENLGINDIGTQADIFFKGDKVGYIYDDGWNSDIEVIINVDKANQLHYAIEEAFEITDMTWKKRGVNPFFEHLLEFSLHEKFFKEKSKRGYEAVVFLNYIPRTQDGLINYNTQVDIKENMGRYLKSVNKVTNLIAIHKIEDFRDLIKKEQPTYYRLYTTIEDFIIEEPNYISLPKQLNAIENLKTTWYIKKYIIASIFYPLLRHML